MLKVISDFEWPTSKTGQTIVTYLTFTFAFEKGLRISLGGYSALDNSPSVARCSLLVELYSSHLFKESCFEMKGLDLLLPNNGFIFVGKKWT